MKYIMSTIFIDQDDARIAYHPAVNFTRPRPQFKVETTEDVMKKINEIADKSKMPKELFDRYMQIAD